MPPAPLKLVPNSEYSKDVLLKNSWRAGSSSRRFWVRLEEKVQGPFVAAVLRHLPGFMLQTLVRPDGEDAWRPAFEVVNLKEYFASPTPAPDNGLAASAARAAMFNAFAVSSVAPKEQASLSLSTVFLWCHLLFYGLLSAWLGTRWVQSHGRQIPTWAQAVTFSRDTAAATFTQGEQVFSAKWASFHQQPELQAVFKFLSRGR